MTVTVTENPIGIRQGWTTPSGGATGVPVGQLLFGNQAVALGATTAEDLLVSINCALPPGWTYRLVEARVKLAFGSASTNEWSRFAEGQIISDSPSDPGGTLDIPFELSGGRYGDVANPNIMAPLDGSALPFKQLYGPVVPLPSVPILSRSPTTLCRLFFAQGVDTAGAGEMTYYLRFMIYTIADDARWAIHSQVPVIA